MTITLDAHAHGNNAIPFGLLSDILLNPEAKREEVRGRAYLAKELSMRIASVREMKGFQNKFKTNIKIYLYLGLLRYDGKDDESSIVAD